MRKVKVLALLLAALMVVAVFAGCADTSAIESDVANLDERVDALEGKINGLNDSINEQNGKLDNIADSVENDQTAEQLAALQAALKAQEEANKALLEQLEKLNDKVDKVEDNQNKTDEGADDAAALEAAVKAYTAKLQEMKIACELNKADYLAADYEAVVTAIANAITAIATAEKAADVEKIFNDTKAIYDTKATVIVKLIGYYNAVRNAITVDSKALVEEIGAYVNGTATTASVVNTVYPVLPASVTAYKNGDKNLDGTDVTVNLVTELKNAIAAYNYLVATTGGLKDAATAATNAIKAIGTVKFGVSDTAITNARTAYNDFAAKVTGLTGVAVYLADTNIAMVENLAVLTDAEARIQNLKFADVMYLTLGGSKDVSVFKAYNELPVQVDFQKKAVYDTINVALSNWATTYAVDVENAKLIIDAAEQNPGFYATYLAHNDKVNLFASANTAFAPIAARIATLNKVTVLSTAAFNEYADVTKAIEAWKVVRADDTTTTTVNEKVEIDNYNFVRVLAANGLVLTSDVTAPAGSTLPVVDMTDIANSLSDKNITKAANYFGLYAFADTATSTFFSTTYAAAKKEADFINAAIATLKSNLTAGTKYTSIERHVDLEGVYTVSGANYVKATVTKADYATKQSKIDRDGDGAKNEYPLTIASYKANYVTTAYDLTSLLNLADFEAAKTGAIDRIAGFKKGAENVEKLIGEINFTKVKAGADAFSYAKFVEGTDAESAAIYYVNLSDADAVAAANKAYTEWVASGANSNLREWVQVVDATTGEVVADTYTFVSVVDTDALAALKQMNDDVVILKDMAKKVIAHFELVAEVWDEVAAMVDLAAEENAADVKVLSLTKAVLSAGVDAISKKALATPVALSGASAISFVVNGVTYRLAAKGNDVLATDAVTRADDLQALIDAGNNAYEAFMVMNRALTYKADGSLNAMSYEKYTDVENAVKLIAAAELVMVKDVFLNTIEDAFTAGSITAGQRETFTEWVLGATAVKGYTGNNLRTYAVQILANGGISIGNIDRGLALIDTNNDKVLDVKDNTAATIYEDVSSTNITG